MSRSYSQTVIVMLLVRIVFVKQLEHRCNPLIQSPPVALSLD